MRGRIALLAVAGAAVLAPAAGAAPVQELVQRYAPVVRLVEQTDPCGHGEPFEPTDVNLLFDNPEVALRGPWDTTSIVKVAPTARDLSAGLFDYNLDFPGNALSPGCTYDEWAQRLTSGSPPRAYARVHGDAAYPGKLAVQYWFFYPFNDFNNRHEGDWEMIQLDFAAASAEEALAKEPAEVGYSQHEGAERAAWGDSKLRLVDGTHPVVYAARGSHANYYGSELYLGRSAAQGVGCDDTVGPSRDVRPEISFVPEGRSAYLSEYPWLGYLGRWGERHRSFYNGPTGPNTKTQWDEPLTWAADTWRDTSYEVPVGSSVGHSTTDFFCGAIAAGSALLTAAVGNPSAVLVALAVVLALLLWLATRTRWDLAAPFRVRRRRPWGSLVTSAFRLYRHNLRLFLGIGLLFVPLGIAITAIQYSLFHGGTLAPLVDSAGETNALVGLLAVALGVFLTIFGLNVVQATTAAAMVELDEGREVGIRSAYRLALRRLPRLIRSLAFAILVVVLLELTGIGIVVAVWLVVLWSLLPAVVMLEDGGRPLRRSAHLVRGNWLRVATVTVFVTGIGLLLGPVIGTLLLLLTSASFDLVNLVAAVIYVIALPFVAITTTYLYFDLLVRERLETEETPSAEVLPAEI